jgi:hypothetical protein
MFGKKNLKQEGGADSTNLQGQKVVINNGITYSDAKEIALDVFKSNFFEFSEKAKQIATERAEDITTKFIDKFFSEIPHLKNKLEEPSIQSSIFNTQKEFAKTGDLLLEEHLLNILVERINSEERSLKQIVLDEALLVIPKLTNDQIDILTLIFSVYYLNRTDVVNLESLQNMINNEFLIFYPENKISYSFFTHLQFTGCCTILSEGSTYKPIDQILKIRFKGLFNKGFSMTEFKNLFPEYLLQAFEGILLKCLHDPALFQINALTDESFNNSAVRLNLAEKTAKLKSLFDDRTMSEIELKEYLVNVNPKMNNLLSDWQKTDIKILRPTSVGFAIAVLNYNRKTGLNLNLEHFI